MDILQEAGCRVCIEVMENTPLHPLADEDTRGLFEDCTSVEVQLSDGYPQYLCEECYSDCVRWVNFKHRAMQTDAMFRNGGGAVAEFNEAEEESTMEPCLKADGQEEVHYEGEANEYAIECDDEGPNIQEEIISDQNQAYYSFVEAADVQQEEQEEEVYPSQSSPSAPENVIDENYCTEDLQETKRSPEKMTLYKCGLCSITLTTPEQLREHELFHKNVRNLKCEYCGKGFLTSDVLMRHLQTHGGERPYKCSICDDTFASKVEMTVHGKTHKSTLVAKDKPFKCHRCPKSYNSMRTLGIHLRVHTGEKPLKCCFCKQTFAQLYQLGLHEEKHWKAQPLGRRPGALPWE